MSTYKTHCCRKRIRRKENSSWEENLMVLVFFILLVSLNLLFN